MLANHRKPTLSLANASRSAAASCADTGDSSTLAHDGADIEMTAAVRSAQGRSRLPVEARGPRPAVRNRTGPLSGQSDRLDVFSSRSLGALAFRERDTLALLEVLEPHALYCGHVEEEILPAAGLDEPETLVRQPLDGAFSHSMILGEDASFNRTKVFGRK
jgi:hypothetical protein